MTWHWYVARSNELLIDLDHPAGGPLRRLHHFDARLRGAIHEKRLEVINYWIWHSTTPWHYQAAVRLSEPMEDLSRRMWEMRLADDGARALMNLARLVKQGDSKSLLISNRRRSDYWREPDYFCRCEGKHKPDVMLTCPVNDRLNCALDRGYFGKPIYSDIIKVGKQ